MPAITDFIASMSRANGFARVARYEIVLTPPAGMVESLGIDLTNYTRDISLMCDTIAMPGHDLQTHSAKYGTGLETMMVNGHGYEGTITTTFYMDTNLETKSYFELWQNAAVSNANNKARYYKNDQGKPNYAGTMKIYQLGSDIAMNQMMNSPFDGKDYTGEWEGPRNSYRNKRQVNQMVTKRTYGMEVEEVYPATIGQIEYAYATVDTLALLPVEFQFRRWKTMDPRELDDVDRVFTR